MHFSSIDEFLPYYENIRERTNRVIAAVPDGSYDWTYREGKFTIADLLRHLAAIERWMVADSPEEVREYLASMHAQAMEIFAGLSPGDLQRHCETPGGATITVWKWLRAMVEHEIHHRGQIYLYLGMLGLPSPPLYGLVSEEVRERSVQAPPSAQ